MRKIKKEILIDNICYIFNNRHKTATIVNADHCCKSTEINIPEKVIYEGVEYKVTKIGIYAFSYCKLLETIVIPDYIKEITMCAFANCESLKSIVLPKKLKTIQFETFKGCTSLESIIIPANIKTKLLLPCIDSSIQLNVSTYTPTSFNFSYKR
mgnify:CR=1 FL=1